MKSQQTRNNAIEFLRIIFTFAIILFHIFGVLDPKVAQYLYIRHARICVEFFFIISGYFLYKECLTESSFQKIAFKRFFRLFPAVYAVTVVMAVCLHVPVSNIIPDFFLLSSIGIAQKSVLAAYCWFVYPLFWVSCFYFVLSKIIKNDWVFNLITALLIYFSLVILSDYSTVFGDTKKTYYHFFNAGMLRAVVCIGIGVLIAKNLQIENNLSKRAKLICTCVELFVFGYLFAQLFVVKAPDVIRSSVVFISLFCLLFISFIHRLGYFSNLLDKIKWQPVSKYCYSWYVAQCIPLLVVHKVFQPTLKYSGGGSYNLLSGQHNNNGHSAFSSC